MRFVALAAALALGLTACKPPEEERTAETMPGGAGVTEPGAPPALEGSQQPPVGDQKTEIHTSGAEPADQNSTGAEAGR